VPLLFCLWRMLPRPASTVPLLTAPALLMNFGSGQTGFYAAAAFAGALILIADQPILAGICLGALVFKPHFALLVPFALAASGRWRSLFACASTAGSLCAVSWLVLPAATWPAFLAQAGPTRGVMEHASTSALLISVFGALHVAGVYLPLAYTGQATAAALCILLVVTAGRRTAWRGTASRPTASRPTASHPKASHPTASHNRDNGAGEIALIAAAALCVTPYAMDYDLTVTMVAAVWLVAEAHRTAWRPWEKLAVAAVALLPLFARATVIMTGFQPAPIVLGVFVCMVWRRAMAVPIT
jgi:alpha-1,2-mannosyltransferase